jgi:hypothetical protein
VEFAPYDLFAHELVGEGRDHRSLLTGLLPGVVGDLRSRGVWQFFIVSRVLSPELLADVETASLGLLANNGAIGLQVDAPLAVGLDLTLTLTAVFGDEVVQHDEYDRAFRAIATRARRLSR